MGKLFLALILTMTASLFATAQTATDYKQSEFYIGYSNGQVDTGIDTGSTVNSFLRDRANFHGFEVAGVYNVNRYVGIKGDISATYNKNRFSFPVTTGTTTQTVNVDTKNSLYNFVGGIQLKDNASVGRIKPFAHAMIGAGHGRTKATTANCTTTTAINCSNFGNDSETGFAGVFGGGLDIRINDRVDFRAFQVDYNPIKFNNGTDHNVRFGIGIVIK